MIERIFDRKQIKISVCKINYINNQIHDSHDDLDFESDNKRKDECEDRNRESRSERRSSQIRQRRNSVIMMLSDKTEFVEFDFFRTDAVSHKI